MWSHGTGSLACQLQASQAKLQNWNANPDFSYSKNEMGTSSGSEYFDVLATGIHTPRCQALLCCNWTSAGSWISSFIFLEVECLLASSIANQIFVNRSFTRAMSVVPSFGRVTRFFRLCAIKWKLSLRSWQEMPSPRFWYWVLEQPLQFPEVALHTIA